MLTVRFIRHGESAANAGNASSDPALIPLTERGIAQAQAVADSFDVAPDLIVVSPFERAQDTALPTIKRFPGVPVEVWPVEEFTYLSPVRCANTTAADRKPWVDTYWNSADPESSDGHDTESFGALVTRAQSTLVRLSLTHYKSIAIFGHGQFMQIVRWILVKRPLEINSSSMREFRAYDIENPIANCAWFECNGDKSNWTMKE